MKKLSKFEKEHKLDLLKGEIFKIICDNTFLTQENYNQLYEKLVEYNLINYKLNEVNIGLDYEDISQGVCYGYSKIEDKVIRVNSAYFNYGDNWKSMKENFVKLIKLIGTLSHESTHHADSRKLRRTDPNAYLLNNSILSSIQDLGLVFEDKQDFFDGMSSVLYYTDRAEVLARTLAQKESRKFLQELEDFIKLNYPVTKEVEEEKKKYLEKRWGKYDKVFDHKNLSTLSKPAFKSLVLDFKLKFMKDKFNELKKGEDETLALANSYKKKKMDKLKKDYKFICEHVMDPNCKYLIYKNISLFSLAKIQQHPELFNQELAQKLYKCAKQKKHIYAMGALCEIKDFNINEKERTLVCKEFNKAWQKLLSENEKEIKIN